MLEIYRTDVLMCAENTIDYANILYIFLRKMGNYNIEHTACILIDGNFKLIEAALTGRGNVESAKSDCDTVLKRAKSLNAKYVISAHNHPSGNLCSSKADVDAFKYNKEFYSEEGINFIDELIVANDKDGNFGVYSVFNDFKIEYKPNSNYKMYCDKIEKEIRIKAIKNEGMAKSWNIYSRWEEESLGKITTPKDRNNILANIFRRSSQLFNRDGLLEIYRTPKDKIIQVKCYAEIYDAIEKCSNSSIYSNERSGYILLDDDHRLLEVIVDSYNTNVFISRKLPMIVKRAKAIGAKKLINFYARRCRKIFASEIDNCYEKQAIFKENGLVLLESYIKCGESLYGMISEGTIKFTHDKALNIIRNRKYEYKPIKIVDPNAFEYVWGIYERWEKESQRPVVFDQDAFFNESIFGMDMNMQNPSKF